jgi:4-diphosphocytidyl-2-C-methyl-D-erythritol kinase
MQQDRLTLAAPAKINLYLRVIGRRPDGYHLLDTLMQKVSLYDEIELLRRPEGIRLRCSGCGVPENRMNLVYRAAELLLTENRERRGGSECGVEITLTKKIPVAAGLGGGSSDAAATLKGLNDLYGCGFSPVELAEMGLRLGADVPFFLNEASAAVASGVGEILHPAEPLSGYSVLLINPGFPVSTRWVYQNYALTKESNASKLTSLKKGDVETQGCSDFGQAVTPSTILINDLEAVTVSAYPEIGRLKDELLHNGATKALMSGSGPTVFGLFADRQPANFCLALFKSRFDHTYLVSPVEKK